MKMSDVYNSKIRTFFDTNYLRWLPEDISSEILDVGFGWGSLLAYLKDLGYSRLTGVEISSQCRDFVSENICPNVFIVDDLPDYCRNKTNSFDLIFLKEVVYYLPISIVLNQLKLFHSMLKPGGRIIVEANNGALLTSQYIVNKDYLMIKSYTEFSLRNLLQDSGFHVRSVYGAKQQGNSIRFFLWRVAQRLWFRILRLVYFLERGSDPENPRIFEKILVAVGDK